jgi:hypothetical protein
MSKPERMKRLGKKAKARAKKAAAKLPAYMQDIVFSYADNRPQPPKGTFGPASEVRHIDPSEYKGDL